MSKESNETSRREFLKQAGLGAVALAVAGPALTKALAQEEHRRGPRPFAKGTVDLGPVTGFKTGSVTDHSNDAGAMIVRTSDGLIALSPTCTHEGCSTQFSSDSQSFVCPCHRAEFKMDGQVKRGPARMPLAYYPVAVKQGRLLVNTDKLIQRSNVQTKDFLKV